MKKVMRTTLLVLVVLFFTACCGQVKEAVKSEADALGAMAKTLTIQVGFIKCATEEGADVQNKCKTAAEMIKLQADTLEKISTKLKEATK